MRTRQWWSTLISTWLSILVGLAGSVRAQDVGDPQSPRIALVIGLGAYRPPLPTAANDAGLVAQTLAAAGFDVTAARDLGGDSLRQAFRDFLDKAVSGGPRGVAMVYIAGRAVQFEGENYIVPVDARLARETDIPIETLRLGDFTRALAATNLGVKLVVIDGAHGEPDEAKLLGRGLALVDADPGSLLAFNAAPGSLAPVEPGPYGSYATALVAAMKQGGVPVEEVFARLRVAVDTDSRGAVVPWSVSKLVTPFTFFDRSSDAPAVGSAQIPFASLRTRPLRDFTPEQAYDVAIARDSLPGYEEYLTAFPQQPLSRRITVLLAHRREALFWRDALRAKSAPAFWTYLDRYPRGPHASEAQRRLTRLEAGRMPPPNFTRLSFDVPPPPPDEIEIVEPGYRSLDLPPPPQPPVFLLPPPLAGRDLPVPLAEDGPGLLPLPAALAIPFVRPILAPGLIRPPRHVRGAYRQARPFDASPNNDRLIPRASDSGEPMRGPLLPDEPRRPKPPALPLVPAPPPLAPGRPASDETPSAARPPRPGEPRPGEPERAGGPARPGEPPRRGEPVLVPAVPDAPPSASNERPGRRAGRRRPDADVTRPPDLPVRGRAERRRDMPAVAPPQQTRAAPDNSLPRPGRPAPPAIVDAPAAPSGLRQERLPRASSRPADPLGGDSGGRVGLQPRLRPQPELQGQPQFQGQPFQRAPNRFDNPAFRTPGAPSVGQMQGLQPRIGVPRQNDGLSGGRPFGGRSLNCGGAGQLPCR